MTTKHVVREGDCLSSIAYRHGFFPGTLWAHPLNSELKRLRGNWNVLLAGDVVHIPELSEKIETRVVDRRHRFRRRGVPERFRLQLLEGGEPRAGLAFQFVVHGSVIEGTTEDDGVLDVPISPDARTGLLRLIDSGEQLRVLLGHLDPVSETTGVQARLFNLGFYDGPSDGAETSALMVAVRDFQAARGLAATGELDAATRAELEAVHDA